MIKKHYNHVDDYFNVSGKTGLRMLHEKVKRMQMENKWVVIIYLIDICEIYKLYFS